MSASCSMLAMTRSRPPHCRQVSRSMANTRLRRCAQVRFGEQSAAEAAPCGLAWLAAAARVAGLVEIQARSIDEPRSIVIARLQGTFWSAVVTVRDGSIRIISVRRSRPTEVALYES